MLIQSWMGKASVVYSIGTKDIRLNQSCRLFLMLCSAVLDRYELANAARDQAAMVL